jgi:hypothetical protein
MEACKPSVSNKYAEDTTRPKSRKSANGVEHEDRTRVKSSKKKKSQDKSKKK